MAFKGGWKNDTPANPVTVTFTAAAAGDLLIGWALTDATTAGDADGTPAGWTRVTGLPLTSTFDNETFSAFWKVAAGGETSVTFTGSSGNTMTGGVVSYDGVDTGTPMDVSPVTFSSSANSTTTDISITPVTNGAQIVYVLGQDCTTGTCTFSFSTTAGTTGSWTTRVQQSNGAFYNSGAGDAPQTTAGAITARGTASISGGRVGVLFALRPSGPAAYVLPATQASFALAGQPASLRYFGVPSVLSRGQLGGGAIGAGPAGSVTTGLAPSGSTYTLTGAQASFAVTGQAAALRATRTLAATQGSVAVTGQAANLVHGYRLSATVGTFAETGQAANLRAGRRLAATQASVALTGQAAGLLAGHRLAASQGSIAVTGQAATLRRGYSLSAAQAAFAVSGQAAGLLVGRRLTGAQGSVAVTGQAATLRAARRLSATQGSIVVNGQAANLVKSSPGAYTLLATQAAFAISGQAAGLLFGRRLSAAQGSATLAGQAAALRAGRLLAAAQAAVALTGQAAGLVYSGGPAYSSRPISCICIDDADSIRASVTDRGLFVLVASDADTLAVHFSEATDGVTVADQGSIFIVVRDMTCTC